MLQLMFLCPKEAQSSITLVNYQKHLEGSWILSYTQLQSGN